MSVLDTPSVATLVEACNEAAARIGRMFAPPVDRSLPLTSQLAAITDALRGHAEGFDTHGVTLVIELAQETLLPSPELLRQVCEGIDTRAVGVVYDPANMIVEGNLHPWLALEVLGDYLHHVHVKNEAFVRTADRWGEAVMRLDQGLVDWPTVFGELEERQYDGWIAIDHLSAAATEERLIFEKELVDEMWNRRAPGSALAYRRGTA
jgi:sugar phosphate isomerase/epimerase